MKIYTIYDRPDDFPNEVVGRISYIKPNSVIQGELFGRGKTVEEVRSQLPSGLICLGRQPHDRPQIVESWM